MKQVRFEVSLTLVGPVLTRSSAAGKLGIDDPVARNSAGQCVLPFSLVKGRVRQSWEELFGSASAERCFGTRLGGWNASRGNLRFTDFTAGTNGASRRLHRIRIDASTGAADDGALIVIESPFAAGEQVTFTGDVSFFAKDDDEMKAIAVKLESAFRWSPTFGAERTTGFGRVAKLDFATAGTEVAGVDQGVAAGSVYDVSLTLEDSFCLARRRIDENFFESDDQIPGAVLRGVVATTLNRLLGHDAAEPIAKDSTNGTQWSDLGAHFNAIRFTHLFPSSTDSRPYVAPMTIVHADETFCDVALAAGPALIGKNAPEFEIDWKEAVRSAFAKDPIAAEFQRPEMKREVRVRTAISRKTGRAADTQLFAYELVKPEGVTWLGSADFSAIPDKAARAAAVAQLNSVLATKPAAFGKTKARGTVVLNPRKSSLKPAVLPPDGQWVITLQTPAILCDPDLLNETSDRAALFRSYADAWHDISGGSLQLERFFADQSLAGGYLVHRFQGKQPYRPFLLTRPGSVFVLTEVADQPRPKLLDEYRLPLPMWARNRYGDEWHENPFLPDDGFGEIAVNLKCHRAAVNVCLQPVSTDSFAKPQWTPPPKAEREVRLQGTSAQFNESLPPPELAQARNRWRIKGRLKTKTSFHLGDGGDTTRHKQLVTKGENEKETDVRIASVATDHEGKPYIPGSSLKGALRSWLTAHQIDKALVSKVFGDVDTKLLTARAGSAEFHDAFLIADRVAVVSANIPWWCPKRLTGVTTAVAIDRWTRTASDKKLQHREYVPADVTFDLSITGQDLDESEVALILYSLSRFNEDADPVALGAETREGWGRFEWTVEPIETLDVDEYLQAVSGNDEPVGGYKKRDVTEFAAAVATIAGQTQSVNTQTIAVSIDFDGPFLVNDPSRTKKEKDPESTLPNHAARINEQGEVVLPVSSLRGALRAQAEKILRTLEPDRKIAVGRVTSACHASGVDACGPISSAAQKSELCLVCQIFGSGGWAAAISISTPSLGRRPDWNRDPIQYRQEFVAIDRFTGGGADSAKFNADVYWKPTFETRITIDLERVGQGGAGLLALVLRDLAEGDIVLGFGASKGYGVCTARVDWPANLGSDVATLHRLLGIPQQTSTAGSRQQALQTGAPATHTEGTSAETPKPPAGGPLFHNPYHFVPASKALPLSIEVSDIKAHKQAHLTFDRYVPSHYSGRLLCKLTTETPLVIGAKQQDQRDKNTIRTVDPFVDPSTSDPNKIPMIPATSLRGMISSIAEAATNSALRVLENRFFSVRRGVDESLQAIGMIVDTPNGKCVRPLALPALTSGIVPIEYRELFPTPILKIFVNGYEETDARPPSLTLTPGSFLDRNPGVKSFSADHTEYWYLNLAGSTLSYDSTSGLVKASRPHEKTRVVRGREVVWLIGMKVGDGQATPIDEASYQSLSPTQKEPYVRGILRVLGIEGRQDEIPTTKKHEIFIPYDPVAPAPLLDAREAIEEFERLAKERTEDDKTAALPFVPAGSLRNSNPNRSKLVELRQGDIVFFKPTRNLGGPKVEHLALSSIWRRQVDGKAHEFWQKISEELLPFNPSRKKLTIAEQMFGFVSAVPRGDKSESLALASRIRLSATRLVRLPAGETKPFLDPVPLKILSSPKPPSPAFYFRQVTATQFISKAALTRAFDIPQGRKFYLHHPTAWKGEPWRTADERVTPGQKALVTPIRRGAEFFFHIDFENLTREELQILCYSIRPAPKFLHKLGMGKSIGLGSVRIDPSGLFLISRLTRYSQVWSENHERFDECWVDPTVMTTAPASYDREIDAASSAPTLMKTFGELRDGFVASGNTQTRALELLGDPDLVRYVVHTPQLDGSKSEEKTYEWFGKNEDKRNRPQFLVPLDGQDELPTLSGRFTEARPSDPPRRQPSRPAEAVLAAPPPRGEVLRDRQPAARDLDPWLDASLSYDVNQHLIIAKRPSGVSATKQVAENDPDIVQVIAGAVVKRVLVRTLPNKSLKIARIEFA